MDSIKKDTVVITIGSKFTSNEFKDPDKLMALIQEQKDKGMDRVIFSMKWPLLSYDEDSNPRCLCFLETREETDDEYEQRMEYDSTLNKINGEVLEFINSICSLSLDNSGFDDGSIKKQYEKLLYKYQKTSVQMNPYHDSFIRLNDKNNLFFPVSELSKRTFAYPRNTAGIFLKKWTEKHPTTERCPVSYRDTLNIPFQEIKEPK